MALSAFECFACSASLLTLVGALVACGSHEDNVCQNAGNCAQGGSNDWIQRCQDEARRLRSEAVAGGCGVAFDDYYACADSNYTCHGATPEYPGCDGKLASLDACLQNATASTSCATLQALQTACVPNAADAGSEAGLPPACTLARDCQAQCYIAQVSNICAPRVDELSNFVTCAASCPP
jgi:hypothetical protein